MSKTVRFLGISFWNAPLSELFDDLWMHGGLLVVPAAPALAELPEDPSYEAALRQADFAIIDSAVVGLLIAFTRMRKVERISGLRFLQALLLGEERRRLAASRILWVVPNHAEAEGTRRYLRSIELSARAEAYYQAPHYRLPGDFHDATLFADVKMFQPDCVIICIGGGKQEKLGLALRNQFPKQFPIICIGAAIAFLTGSQARIPTWADRAGLGWLVRTLHNPRVFGPRYWKAAWKFPRLLFWKPSKSGAES